MVDGDGNWQYCLHLAGAWSFNTISSATLLNGSSSEIESDTYSSDISASDRNMSLSEMYLEASRINKRKTNL